MRSSRVAPSIASLVSRLPRPISTNQDLLPSDLEHADRMAVLERGNLDDRATPGRRLAEEKAKIDVEIEQDLEAIRNRTRKPITEEEIAASHARVLAENARFVERLERDCAGLKAKDLAENGEAKKAKRAKWMAEFRSPFKQFRLSLDSSVLMSMSTDITKSVEKRARLVRPRHFVVSSSNTAASNNTIENATPVRPQLLDRENPSPAVSDTSSEHSHISSFPASTPETLGSLSYLLNQANTTRVQLHAIESSINSILAETSSPSSITPLTWSSSRNCYELQPARPAALPLDIISTQFEDNASSEAWYSARDFPDESESVDDEVDDLQKMLDAGQEWMKVASEVMHGMKGARCSEAEI